MKTKNRVKEIVDYDSYDTSKMIKASKPLKLEDIGLRLPNDPPTQIVSLRLPTRLLNAIKAIGSEQDVPYQALIKLMLSSSLGRFRK